MMGILKNKIIWIGVITILASNSFLAALLIRERSLRHDFSMSSESWASIAGLYKAELDYQKGIRKKMEQYEGTYTEDFDVIAWKSYLDSYNKKLVLCKISSDDPNE